MSLLILPHRPIREADVILFLLSACSPSTDPAKTGDDTAADTAQDTAEDSAEDTEEDSAEDSGEDTAEDSGAEDLAYSGGTCPVLVDGRNEDFVSGDALRKFRVLLPADPEGAGVVFAWHWLGGSAQQIINYMDLQTWADDLGFIIVAPDASGDEAYEWDFLSGPNGNPDALFFDDLVACTHETWNTDLDNLHATGMSAGGLWTTWLTNYRADVLATTAPISGGETSYVAPEDPIPVLLTWGGPDDTYGGFSFADASEVFSAALLDDGHFVINCVHDGGHTIPTEAADYIGRFFADHTKGETPEPYADGLPEEFPSWCSIP